MKITKEYSKSQYRSPRVGITDFCIGFGFIT